MQTLVCKKCEQYKISKNISIFNEEESQLAGSTELCILHCEKHNYSKDWNKVGFLNAFYDKLILFLYNQNEEIKQTVSLEDFTSYFDYTNSLEATQKEFISKQLDRVIVFNHIFFPCYDGRDNFDYSTFAHRFQ